MRNRDNTNGNALYASGSQLWRANSLGLLELRDSPGDPIPRTTLKELLGAAVRAGLWQPEVRGERKP
jgi:hypothetical protein